KTQILLRIEKIIHAAFGQFGLLTDRIHSRGRIAAGQEQFFGCGQDTFFGLIGCNFQRANKILTGQYVKRICGWGDVGAVMSGISTHGKKFSELIRGQMSHSASNSKIVKFEATSSRNSKPSSTYTPH